ncbi:hypothetical protein ED312_17320 [Sinomicrobium pectinilyticum]|uniref:Uncharacterized protein n=1 Tax=Sinomicrobium pectinilyticum TaxID=1084421 RepID=A0A3N0E321_SINP1|nr:hypothetical protein [Sinomicrobium pectinilyticum]RNL82238.1 hypothetical protein ED312_17320 [Sinomicrobium pectinilyticum]
MIPVTELLFYCLPAVITGLVAYYFFQQFVKNENSRRHFFLKRESQKDILPIRLQAYERMVLFLERINPSKLLLRVSPNGSGKEEYEALLIRNIEDEYDHNLSQQIYMSDECWNVIKTAKNSTIQLIRKVNMSEKTDSADKLRESILNEMFDKTSPSAAALAYIKKEVGDFLT